MSISSFPITACSPTTQSAGAVAAAARARSTISTAWAPRRSSSATSWCSTAIRASAPSSPRSTGRRARERWRTPRVEARSGHSTPVVYTPPGGRAQIVVPGSFLLSAYDPRDGKRLWWVGGLSFELKSTPVISGDTLYINGFGSPENQPGAKIAVAPTAEVFATHDANKDGQADRPAELPTRTCEGVTAVLRSERRQDHRSHRVGLLQGGAWNRRTACSRSSWAARAT